MCLNVLCDAVWRGVCVCVGMILFFVVVCVWVNYVFVCCVMLYMLFLIVCAVCCAFEVVWFKCGNVLCVCDKLCDVVWIACFLFVWLCVSFNCVCCDVLRDVVWVVVCVLCVVSFEWVCVIRV